RACMALHRASVSVKAAVLREEITPPVLHQFLHAVRQDDIFETFVQEIATGRFRGVDEEVVAERVGQLCSHCYWECEKLMVATGESHALASARADVERLQRKITDCNLSAMKQLEAFRQGGQDELDDELRQFFEPLQYMSESARELVLMCVVQKLRQLDAGTASNSFMRALLAIIASMGGNVPAGVPLEDTEEDNARKAARRERASSKEKLNSQAISERQDALLEEKAQQEHRTLEAEAQTEQARRECAELREQ
ncbi:unnamed protein product, partial [Polarella glacialis]